MNCEKAFEIVKKYNKEPFHIRHALTVGGVMKYFAENAGEDGDFWAGVGILHDVDFELYPNEHCVKAQEILKNENVDSETIYAVCSHGYGLTPTPCKPEKYMEKVLFAVDELTGLIGAAAIMRPSKSVSDMELSSVKKKFKDKKFAQGCSRDVIEQGANDLGIPLDDLIWQTVLAMRVDENRINEFMQNYTA
jgi:predicted hydrolase (HD superfamily)